MTCCVVLHAATEHCTPQQFQHNHKVTTQLSLLIAVFTSADWLKNTWLNCALLLADPTLRVVLLLVETCLNTIGWRWWCNTEICLYSARISQRTPGRISPVAFCAVVLKSR